MNYNLSICDCFTGFFCVLHPFPSVAKKLGGKLEVVSFDDDLEGGLLFFLKMSTFWGGQCVYT